MSQQRREQSPRLIKTEDRVQSWPAAINHNKGKSQRAISWTGYNNSEAHPQAYTQLSQYGQQNWIGSRDCATTSSCVYMKEPAPERAREVLHLSSHTGLSQVLPGHPLADSKR